MSFIASALRRPITVLVAVIAMALAGLMALLQMPRDVFPTLGIPTIYVAQPYGGMDPAQMEGFLTYYYEYHFLYITGIEHVESKSIQGNALIKLQFHPATDLAQAMAEVIGYVNRARAFMPPGTVPPFVMRFDAGSVPVGNLVFSSGTRSVGELQDLALNRVRPLFATLPGVSAPPPFGGNQRSIVIHVKPDRLRAYNMSPDDVVAALASANLVSPSGNIRIDDVMPMVPTNATVSDIRDLESVPLRLGSAQTVLLRDVGRVEDATDIPTGYALVNGRRTVYIPVTKRADASTLTVVGLVKQNLGRFQAVLPDDVKVHYEFDQSPYVTRAIHGLTLEGLLGAILTGLMVLLFLRDWRSALIVAITIPLSLLAAQVPLWLTHQTVNIMTLGGLALAVGILVDESTVTIENVHTHLARGKSLARAVVESGHEVAVPLLLSMLCVLAVFVPSFFMSGVGRALFVPLSLAVGFSMVASYALSRMFVPVLCAWMLKPAAHAAPGGFARLQIRYGGLARRAVAARIPLLAAYALGTLAVVALLSGHVGRDIFPVVDAGQLQVRLRARPGTRIERTEALTLRALDLIKGEVGGDRVAISLAFVGVQPPNYPINTIYLWTGGPEEAVLQVQLKSGARTGIAALQERLRQRFAAELPELAVSFEPADIVSRVMSLGSTTPIEVAISGPSLDADRAYAAQVRDALAGIAALRDLQYGQALDYPAVQVDVDRQRAGVLGVTAADVARATLMATSSSRFVTPNYWRDPRSGLAFQVQVEIPTPLMNSLQQIENLPVKGSQNPEAQYLLRNVAQVRKGTVVGEYDRYNMQRMVSLTANIAGADLGHVSEQVRRALDGLPPPPPGVKAAMRGETAPLLQVFGELRGGLLLAVVVIFLLLAANFESFPLSAVVVSAVPAVVAGVLIALWASGTTLNLDSFMGAIMAIGVAVANAVLLVTFAERSRRHGAEAAEAAVEGAVSRLRPILMTSFAMMAGMLPMALALGEGGQQTAPLGRAVIGGVAAATVATLTVLPAVFAMVQQRRSRRSPSLDPHDPTSLWYEAQP